MLRHKPTFHAVEKSAGDETMPEAAVNSYKIDRRAIEFTLYEHLHVEQLFEHERYAHLSRAEVEELPPRVLESCRCAHAPGDRSGCQFEAGRVRTPAGFQDAWRKLFDLG